MGIWPFNGNTVKKEEISQEELSRLNEINKIIKILQILISKLDEFQKVINNPPITSQHFQVFKKDTCVSKVNEIFKFIRENKGFEKSPAQNEILQILKRLDVSFEYSHLDENPQLSEVQYKKYYKNSNIASLNFYISSAKTKIGKYLNTLSRN